MVFAINWAYLGLFVFYVLIFFLVFYVFFSFVGLSSCVLCPLLAVSLDCAFFISLSVFSNVYL